MHKSICGQINKLILGVCVWFLYLWSMILDFDMCVWCVHKCMQIMMHISIILDLDTCVYDVHTCVYDVHMCVRCAHMMCVWCVWYTYLWSWSLILVHACMMQVSKIIDPDTCVYHAGMYDEFWSSILGPYACVMHECIMYISMILMHACIYDAANFVPDQRTDEQGDSRSWMLVVCIRWPQALCMYFGSILVAVFIYCTFIL